MTETLPSVSSMPKEVKKRVFRSEAEALLPDETAHLARRVGSPAGLTGLYDLEGLLVAGGGRYGGRGRRLRVVPLFG